MGVRICDEIQEQEFAVCGQPSDLRVRPERRVNCAIHSPSNLSTRTIKKLRATPVRGRALSRSDQPRQARNVVVIHSQKSGGPTRDRLSCSAGNAPAAIGRANVDNFRGAVLELPRNLLDSCVLTFGIGHRYGRHASLRPVEIAHPDAP